MARKRMLNTFKLAAELGPYDEYPALPDGVDPQLCLSRNDRQQPFFLVCEKDTVLIQMAGTATIEFRNSAVNYFKCAVGDHIYVPAGTPHRISPHETSIHYRYKAEKCGLEAVAWYCAQCESEIARDTWDTAVELPQEGYLRATTAFNANSEMRKCKRCGTTHPLLDLAGYRWSDIARELRDGGEAEEAW